MDVNLHRVHLRSGMLAAGPVVAAEAPSGLGRRRALQSAGVVGALLTVGLAGAPSASAAPAARRAAPAAPSAPAAPNRRVLKVGSSGADVRELQTLLSGAGYWLGSVDGSFGHLTQQAVWALQKYHGLTRDAICGPATWAKALAKTRPVAKSHSTPHLEIDKRRQLIFVVSGGRVQVCLNTSTGSNKPFKAWGRWYNGQTPSGRFTTFRYKPGWYTNDLGGLYRPVFFNGGIAVHGSTSIPPYNASHGCCRLSVAAQDMLLAKGYLVAKGRSVVVY